MYFSYKSIVKKIECSEKLILNDADILSYGNKRICYYHAKKPSKLIKISRDPKHWKEGHKQSLTEWYVSEKVKSAEEECPISLCHHWINTDKGPGLLVDRISDVKGESRTLRSLLFKRELTVKKAIDLVEETIQIFSAFGIPASDFNIDNFILDGAHDEYKIVMVDGFSPKKTNFKTYLLLNSSVLANLYAKRKWRLIKDKFIYCAQKVYAGDYNFAAAMPLSDTSNSDGLNANQ